MFVQRVNGVITGAFAKPQPGYAEEEIADDDPELLAYQSPPAKRTLLAIVADLNALTGAQKNAVWTDITSGSPPKWSTDAGPNAAAIAVLHAVATMTGLSNADLLIVKIRGVAMYVQDNPGYLVNPAFDPSINVPGVA